MRAIKLDKKLTMPEGVLAATTGVLLALMYLKPNTGFNLNAVINHGFASQPIQLPAEEEPEVAAAIPTSLPAR